MSVQREDKEKSSGSGLGFAAAAIGVGAVVGGALYYFFGKENESPQYHQERSREELDMTDDSQHTIDDSDDTQYTIYDSDDRERTIDDYDDSSDEDRDSVNRSNGFFGSLCSTQYSLSIVTSHSTSDESSTSLSDRMESDPSESDPSESDPSESDRSEAEVVYDSSSDEFDNIVSPRQRAWTLEQCSICFEVMMLNNEVLELPCGHKFHDNCVKEWLDTHKTCPNCRKPA